MTQKLYGVNSVVYMTSLHTIISKNADMHHVGIVRENSRWINMKVLLRKTVFMLLAVCIVSSIAANFSEGEMCEDTYPHAIELFNKGGDYKIVANLILEKLALEGAIDKNDVYLLESRLYGVE